MNEAPVYDWNNPAGPRPSGPVQVFNSVVQTVATALHLTFEQARFTVLGVAAVVVVSTVIVVGINVTQGTPEAGAKAWMQALANQDGSQLSELTCKQLRPQLQQSLALTGAALILGQGFLGTQAKMDLNDLTFTTESNNGTHATVRVKGTVHNGVGLFSNTQQINQVQGMLKEDGKWRVCT